MAATFLALSPVSAFGANKVQFALHNAEGMPIYSAVSDGFGATPLTLRQNQTLELAQSATGGTGNCRIRALFLVGAL